MRAHGNFIPRPASLAAAAVCASLAALALAAPRPASGQISVGAHMAYAVDTFGGTTGVGGQIGYDFIGVPLEVVGGGEYFFPDCDIESCGLWGAYVEGQLRLPLPLVRPYGLAGFTYRSVENLRTSGDTVDSSSAGGLAAGGGLDLNLLALRVFVDARYEFLGDPVEQWVVRVGLNF